MTSGALSEAWGFVRGPKRVPDAADAGRRAGPDRLASPAARSRAPDGRFRPPGRPDQPGQHRQGLRDRPGRRADSRPLVADVGPRSTAVGRASSPSARRPARSAADGRSPLRNPFRPEAPLGVLRLRNRGLGTSGTRVPAVRGRRPGLRPHHRPEDRRAGRRGRPA